MEKIILAVTLWSVAFGCGTAQKRQTVEQVQVTTQSVPRSPSDRPDVLDLTRQGTIYPLATGIDRNRVRVRTSKGEMTIADLLSKSGQKISGPLRIGITNDMGTQKLGLTRAGGGTRNYSCDDLVCIKYW